MAWNEPGKGKKDPWNGKDPGSEVDAFLARLKGMFGTGGGRGAGAGSGGRGGSGFFGIGPIALIAAGLAIWLVLGSFKLVDERERGVVLRFGKLTGTIMQPGLNFKLPWPIDQVETVKTTEVKQHSGEVRVLTRDENLVDVTFNVQYQALDPAKYLFGTERPEEALQEATESAVREVIGTSTFSSVLSERASLNGKAKQGLQAALDLYDTGLTVTVFNLQNARPPSEVKQAFDDAISAREDRLRAKNEADAYSSKILPEAEGNANRIRTEAKGYEASVVARAEGDAQRFRLLAEQYRQAPEVTRRRLYLETMQQVLAANPKVVSGSDDNVLYLPLQGFGGTSPAARSAGAAAGDAQGAGTVPMLTLPPSIAAPPRSSGDERPDRPERPTGNSSQERAR